MARTQHQATILDYQEVDVSEALQDLTGGRGPDACIDAVGMEAHGTSIDALYDRTKMAMFLATDRLHVLRQAIQTCRKGGTVSIPGVYGGLLDKVPMGAAFAKGLTLKMGQTHVHKYLRPLLARIEQGEIDPAFVITHHLRLEEAPYGYEIFRDTKGQLHQDCPPAMKGQLEAHRLPPHRRADVCIRYGISHLESISHFNSSSVRESISSPAIRLLPSSVTTPEAIVPIMARKLLSKCVRCATRVGVRGRILS